MARVRVSPGAGAPPSWAGFFNKEELLKDRLIEVRWHGRGGQGAVTASALLAEAMLEAGRYFQAFPEYGPERSGAPLKAYTRISDIPISQHSQVTNPDAVVVLDPTLIGAVDFAEGLKDGGVLVVNSYLSPAELRQKLGINKGRVFTVDASAISQETIGRNIPNLPMLGALLRALEAFPLEELLPQLEKRLAYRLGEKAVASNMEALKRAYRETRGEE